MACDTFFPQVIESLLTLEFIKEDYFNKFPWKFYGGEDKKKIGLYLQKGLWFDLRYFFTQVATLNVVKTIVKVTLYLEKI